MNHITIIYLLILADVLFSHDFTKFFIYYLLFIIQLNNTIYYIR